MQSMGNDGTISHPSHSGLEDADIACVSHIPTTTATRLDKKDKQLRLLHQSIGLFSSTENAGRITSEIATYGVNRELPSCCRCTLAENNDFRGRSAIPIDPNFRVLRFACCSSTELPRPWLRILISMTLQSLSSSVLA